MIRNTILPWLGIIALVAFGLFAPDAIREIRAAMETRPIPRAVQKYERETGRKALATIDVGGDISRHATPSFVAWLESKSGLTAVRRRVLLETERPLPVQVLFSTVDPDELLRLCKGVR